MGNVFNEDILRIIVETSQVCGLHFRGKTVFLYGLIVCECSNMVQDARPAVPQGPPHQSHSSLLDPQPPGSAGLPGALLDIPLVRELLRALLQVLKLAWGACWGWAWHWGRLLRGAASSRASAVLSGIHSSRSTTDPAGEQTAKLRRLCACPCCQPFRALHSLTSHTLWAD